MKTRGTMLFLCLIISIPVLLSGCGPHGGTTYAQRGAVSGAAVGAITGQIIGRDTKSTLIGAGAGALGGALLNDGLRIR